MSPKRTKTHRGARRPEARVRPTPAYALEPIRLPLKNCPSVAAYIASQPESARATLRRVRAAIRAAVPEARELIAGDMPEYRVPFGRSICFAGWTKHWSIYLRSPQLDAALAAELAPYDVERGTIRFRYGRPVPVELVARIARFCVRGDADRMSPRVWGRS